MPSKYPAKYSLPLAAALLTLLTWSLPRVALAAELSTLFTTPEERRIINSNRYKTDEPRPVESEPETVEIELPIPQRMMEEIAVSYDISGITLSSDGAHTVWINQMAYQDGEQLDDNSRIKVMAGADIRVRITTPDGNHHYAASGETLEVTYLAPIEN